MTRKKWIEKITEKCKETGTYQRAFDPTINMLAEILEQRDKVYKEFKKDGHILVEHTNKSGATNIVKNPLLLMWNDLNKTALLYWRELGLTPASLRRIDENAVKGKVKKSPMQEFGKLLDEFQ